MSEDRLAYGDFKETRLTDHDQREIASRFADALQDLTGSVYAVEILTLQRHPDGQADIRLWIRRVDDSEISGADKGA